MNAGCRRLLAPALTLLALVPAGCGDRSSSAEPQSSGGEEESAFVGGRTGGRLTQLGARAVASLDPGRSYYPDLQVVHATQRTLYSFGPEDSAKPVPDLAEAEPEISDDNRTVTVRIRAGVRFSPPVDREMTSRDVKYAIERFFSANVGGRYAGYFTPLVGAPSQLTRGVRDIAGISTPDDRTLVFALDAPVAPAFAAALVLPATAPVPEEYAAAFDAKRPSTYDAHVVATGPYMVANDAAGKLTGHRPGESISLVRNPNWEGRATGDYRPAYLDEILLRSDRSDAHVAARQVLDRQRLVFDATPPVSVLEEVVTELEDQYVTLPAGGYRYFPMNTTVEPFDDVNVRRAVVAGFDRHAARQARGGALIGDIATHYLPPGTPGFEEAGGAEGPAAEIIPPQAPRGDLALAASHFKKAGYESGRYEGDAEVLVVGANADPGKAQAEVAKTQLERLGFDVRLLLVPQDDVYAKWCQVPARNVGMCAGAAWFQDFADPQSMLEPVFHGDEIRKTGNINYSELDDPTIDAAMEKAALLKGDERVEAWAEIDRMIVESAAGVPFLWDETTLIQSADVNGVANPYYGAWDLNFTSLKP